MKSKLGRFYVIVRQCDTNDDISYAGVQFLKGPSLRFTIDAIKRYDRLIRDV